MSEMELFFKDTGAQGGRKRAENMTKKQRSESARKAALARWKKTKSQKKAKSAGKAEKDSSRRAR